MTHPTEEQVRKRAFELWEQAGKPERTRRRVLGPSAEGIAGRRRAW
ncbi:DUF2934 domain-containing protein [Bradyrhizobium sp. 186]